MKGHTQGHALQQACFRSMWYVTSFFKITLEIENKTKWVKIARIGKKGTKQSLFVRDIIASVERDKKSAKIELMFFQFAITANRNTSVPYC